MFNLCCCHGNWLFLPSGDLLAFDIIGSKAQEIVGNDILKGILLKLKYPQKLIEAAINPVPLQIPPDSSIWIIIPHKDQRSADVIRKQLRNLGRKIGLKLQPIFTSKDIFDDFRVMELKPSLV